MPWPAHMASGPLNSGESRRTSCGLPADSWGGEKPMSRLTCEECRQPIPNGQAHIRTRSFRQVAFCGYCLTVRTILTAVQHAA